MTFLLFLSFIIAEMVSNVNASYLNFSYIRDNVTNQETQVPFRCNRFGRPYDTNNIHRRWTTSEPILPTLAPTVSYWAPTSNPISSSTSTTKVESVDEEEIKLDSECGCMRCNSDNIPNESHKEVPCNCNDNNQCSCNCGSTCTCSHNGVISRRGYLTNYHRVGLSFVYKLVGDYEGNGDHYVDVEYQCLSNVTVMFTDGKRFYGRVSQQIIMFTLNKACAKEDIDGVLLDIKIPHHSRKYSCISKVTMVHNMHHFISLQMAVDLSEQNSNEMVFGRYAVKKSNSAQILFSIIIVLCFVTGIAVGVLAYGISKSKKVGPTIVEIKMIEPTIDATNTVKVGETTE